MSSADPIREALLDARAASVEAIAKIDAALKKMEEVEGLRIAPRHGRLNDAILAYMKMQGEAAPAPAQTQVETSPKEVHEALLLAGWDVTGAAVHQAMYRMGKRGVLYAIMHGTYVLVKENGESTNVPE